MIGLLLQWANIGPSNVGLVFLTAVLMSAVTYGLWPALFACVISALAYNFFFFPPLYTFTIADPGNVVLACGSCNRAPCASSTSGRCAATPRPNR